MVRKEMVRQVSNRHQTKASVEMNELLESGVAILPASCDRAGRATGRGASRWLAGCWMHCGLAQNKFAGWLGF